MAFRRSRYGEGAALQGLEIFQVHRYLGLRSRTRSSPGYHIAAFQAYAIGNILSGC
jgi:hypothetical protein